MNDEKNRVTGPASAEDRPVATFRYTTTQDLHDAARARGEVIGGEAELAAEVERLRGEQVTCSTADNWRARALPAEAEVARLNKENDDWHEASKRLREEAQTKEREIERLCEELGRSHGEAQTARLALDVATKEVAALRARVAELEAIDDAMAALDRFMDCGQGTEDPEPGAAT